jgi:hypothetical protein
MSEIYSKEGSHHAAVVALIVAMCRSTKKVYKEFITNYLI